MTSEDLNFSAFHFSKVAGKNKHLNYVPKYAAVHHTTPQLPQLKFVIHEHACWHKRQLTCMSSRFHPEKFVGGEAVRKKVFWEEATNLHLEISFPIEMTHSSWLPPPLDETLIVLSLTFN